jgi:hypothetical protein
MTRIHALVLALALGSATCVVRTRGAVVVGPAPPPPRVTVVEPRAGYVWIEGRWDWDGTAWVWSPGYWVAERTDHVWVQGVWIHVDGGHRWRPGHWQPRPARPRGRVHDHRRR